MSDCNDIESIPIDAFLISQERSLSEVKNFLAEDVQDIRNTSISTL